MLSTLNNCWSTNERNLANPSIQALHLLNLLILTVSSRTRISSLAFLSQIAKVYYRMIYHLQTTALVDSAKRESHVWSLQRRQVV